MIQNAQLLTKILNFYPFAKLINVNNIDRNMRAMALDEIARYKSFMAKTQLMDS